MKIRSILALVVALAGLLLAAPAAQARAAAPTDPVYPPTTCPTISVSTTHPLPGATITVVGTNFDPNTKVTLRIKSPSIFLRSVVSDNGGSFTTTVKLPPGLFGNRLIIAIGGQTGGCPADPVQITIQNGSSNSGGNGGGNGNNGGGTAFTGTDVAGLLALAAALIGLGVLLNRRSRSAKRAPSKVS
jgi:hypothetical protein